MSLKSKGMRGALPLAIACTALLAPLAGTASAKTYKVKFTTSGKLTKTNTVVGKIHSGSFGKGTQVVKIDVPTSTVVMKFKKGTITLTQTSSLKGTIATGKWKFAKGTGKYKGIKGSGTVSGDITQKPVPLFTYKGTASY